MGAFAVRQVVVLPFPFSDLSAQKLRPALLLSNVGNGDWLLCQITSKSYADNNAIELQQDSFELGSLSRVSYIRSGKLFTANETIFRKTAGKIKPHTHQAVVAEIMRLLNGSN
jgi:mRNA interferase MazF